MKKVFFAIILVSLVSPKMLAQNKKGSLALTGTFSIDAGSSNDKDNGTTVDGPKTMELTILPTVEYFISDRFSAGLGIGLYMYRSKDETTTGMITTTTITTQTRPIIMPYARMYFPMGEKVSFFGQAELYIKPGKEKTTIETGNVSTTTSLKRFYFDAGISPGVSLSLSDKIAIDATFGFIGFTTQKTETSANSSYAYNHTIFQVDPSSITFSIKFFLF